jgi:SAM-dependent methyltransferase
MSKQHYYDTKYPYKYMVLNDGQFYGFYTINMNDLVKIYQSCMFWEVPKTFFDCGCGPGELIRQAESLGIQAFGMDVKRYPIVRGVNHDAIATANIPGELKQKFEQQLEWLKNMNYSAQQSKIEIASIANCNKIIDADMAFCNGTLTYLTEEELTPALARLSFSKVLIAIHNTAEDIDAAWKNGDDLLGGEKESAFRKKRLIKPQDWWMNRLHLAGFDVEYDKLFGCFCAKPARKKIR